MPLPADFSVSQARAFDACPMQYRLRYLTDLEPAVNEEARDFGRAVHSGLAAGYRFLASVEGAPDYPINLLRSVALDALGDRWYSEGLGTGDALDEAREHVLGEFDDVHLAELVARWRVVGVERKLRFSQARPGVTPFSIPMVVVIDLLLEHRNAPVMMVVDHKTGARIASIEDLKTNEQLGVYTLAAQDAFPSHSTVAALNYTGQPPGHRMVTARLDDADLDLVAAKIARSYDEVRDAYAEAAFPARPGAICGWCDYAAVCPAAVGLELVR